MQSRSAREVWVPHFFLCMFEVFLFIACIIS